MSKAQHFLVPDAADMSALTRHFSAAGRPLAWQFSNGRRTLLDTADQRLAAEQLYLVCDEASHEVSLCLHDKRGRRRTGPVDCTYRPSTTAQCPDRRIQQALEPVIEPRTLLLARQWRIAAATADLLNEDDKRIGELVVEQHSGLDEQSTTTVSLWAERGYGREAYTAYERLRGDLDLEPLPMAVNAWMSERSAPGEALLPLREPPKLREHQSTREALATLLAHYHQLMLDQEPGTLNDTDIEFLHEFRVSMRRARSVATAFLSHAPGLEPLCRELAWLNAVTGRLRDLDVWLFDLRRSQTAADAVLRDYLLEHRSRELVRVRKALSTKRYARFNERLERWIDAQRDAPPRGILISDAARAAIDLRYSKMRKRFARYARRPNYDTLHALRKDGKKLRYLLGACVGLLPKSKSAALLEDLKRFQTGVGQMCDRHARAALIEHFLSANPEPPVREALEQTLDHQAPHELTALRPAQARKLERSMARISGRHGERIVARLTTGGG